MTDPSERIPATLRQHVDRQRDQDKRPGARGSSVPRRAQGDAGAAKILALGASVASGIALVGGMAAGSAAIGNGAPPVAAPQERVIVVQIPVQQTNTMLPTRGATATAVFTAAEPVQAPAPATPEPEPVTVSEGS